MPGLAPEEEVWWIFHDMGKDQSGFPSAWVSRQQAGLARGEKCSVPSLLPVYQSTVSDLPPSLSAPEPETDR